MANNNHLLNPVLTLLKDPTPSSITAGGKSREGIVVYRLLQQREVLAKSFESFDECKGVISKHANKAHIIARMFKDSNAPSWTPKDIFSPNFGCRVVAPAFDGYLVEVDVSKFKEMSKRLRVANTVVDLVDISRVQSVAVFDSKETLRNKTAKEIWGRKPYANQFNFWLMPFSDPASRQSVCDALMNFYYEKKIYYGDESYSNPFDAADADVVVSANQTPIPQSFIRLLNRYLTTGNASFSALVGDEESLQQLAASGVSYRIEPVSQISVTSSPPGMGPEPKPPTAAAKLPTVVIVDGGRSAPSYQHCEVLCAPPLVDMYSADLVHGNQISSLVCQGHAWNNMLLLPKLDCNFVTAQVLTKDGVKVQPTPSRFVEYLNGLAEGDLKGARVWNLSFNEVLPNANPEEISYLGHEINKLARKHGILPVISIGNSSLINAKELCPPADCESALTISGRTASATGVPATACLQSLRGPAPAGMKKPDLSWFSELRMIGGGTHVGTSYSTALVSSLAAHTFANLKSPTPDLVRALLINNADGDEHCNDLGWGSPWANGLEPWLCKEGAVTLAWVSKIKPGYAYYWNEIPIPPEMLKDGKLAGRATLTAILKPEVSELGGPNYFSTRLQVALQADSPAGDTVNLLGSMKESKETEMEARAELSKWSPIRRHCNTFKRKSIDVKTVRLYARVFARDLYQFNMNSHHELPEQEVSFVLTFEGSSKSSGIYSSMASVMGSFVESAVLEQDVNVVLDQGQ
jgi:hypothetical protein